MSRKLMNLSNSIVQKHAVNEIVECNNFTAQYGLTLSTEQAIQLVDTRTQSLQENGRIEFGGGIIDKIIKEFYSSPYISADNYIESLHNLTEIFYYYKNLTLDLITDDELISYMHKSFDGICQGSFSLLSDRELAKMAENIRYGRKLDYTEDNNIKLDKDEKDDDEYGQY